MPKAVLVGLGGIGYNVYLPQLKKVGYDVVTVDKHNVLTNPDYEDLDDAISNNDFELAVICTPNYTHLELLNQLGEAGVTNIFVEKPGLPSAQDWQDAIDRFPNSKIMLVKNNLYRDTYGILDEFSGQYDVTDVTINWLNKDRIPNPGNWSTNSKFAWGGVAHDLFPHLYCFMLHLFDEEPNQFERFSSWKVQKWNLENISGTAYGVYKEDGVYDVCDKAVDIYSLNNIPITIQASWKEGIDDQSINLNFADGSSLRWPFGLCPNEAYGTMLQEAPNDPYEWHQQIDVWIHKQLEEYKEND